MCARDQLKGAILGAMLIACSAESAGSGSRSAGSGATGDSSAFDNAAGAGGGEFGNPTEQPIGGGTGTTVIPGGGDSCARVDVRVTRKKPVVMLVVDGSGSMEDPFGGGTRWTELQTALVDPSAGLVAELEAAVEFGLTIYQRGDVASCPTLTQVPFALDNYAAIDSAYRGTGPNGGTPTGEALMSVVSTLPDVNPIPDVEQDPHIIILATDGMPNGCGEITPEQQAMIDAMCPDVPPLIPGFPAGPDPFCVAAALQNLPPDTQSTVDAAHAARDKNISTYVISLAPGLQEQADLQRVANVGLGMDESASPGATIFEPADPASLRDTLLGIIGGAVGCTLELEGTLNVDQACSGTLTLNGTDRSCGDPNGWRAVDDTHIELVGTTCDEFQANPTVTLNAAWPCGVIVPF